MKEQAFSSHESNYYPTLGLLKLDLHNFDVLPARELSSERACVFYIGGGRTWKPGFYENVDRIKLRRMFAFAQNLSTNVNLYLVAALENPMGYMCQHFREKYNDFPVTEDGIGQILLPPVFGNYFELRENESSEQYASRLKIQNSRFTFITHSVGGAFFGSLENALAKTIQKITLLSNDQLQDVLNCMGVVKLAPSSRIVEKQFSIPSLDALYRIDPLAFKWGNHQFQPTKSRFRKWFSLYHRRNNQVLINEGTSAAKFFSGKVCNFHDIKFYMNHESFVFQGAGADKAGCDFRKIISEFLTQSIETSIESIEKTCTRDFSNQLSRFFDSYETAPCPDQ